MAILTDEQKLFIVQALACHDTPLQVCEMVKEEFGIKLERSHVQFYDPTKAAGQDVGKKWKEIFFETRKRFLETASDIPIANQTFRLRTLNRLLAKVEKQGNVSMAAQLVEQAAREVGGAFTNRREASGPQGGPLQVSNTGNLTISPSDAYLQALGKK